MKGKLKVTKFSHYMFVFVRHAQIVTEIDESHSHDVNSGWFLWNNHKKQPKIAPKFL